MLKQTQIKFVDILARLMSTSGGVIQDLEYQYFPEVLSKFIEVQMQVINDRIKNLRIFSSFLSELMGSYD